ncbi:MAG TPA: aminotransferase class V-fold PLP-dependent enzyme [Lacipirellulaceae bacterium]|nr:aminotransferase class V-fold PLP-dependent enzyme [Lacipirellulaceae bacterium]
MTSSIFMWPRKQLDIDWCDLAFGLGQTLCARRSPGGPDVVGAEWIAAEEALVALSVRSGLDLLFTALNLPAGSEVITSAVTISDVPRIIEQHGLRVVPVDVEAERLIVEVDQLERAVTPKTRIVLVAHLFGSRMEMEPIIALARRHDLLVIEDCAQAFVGTEYAGHPESDCVLFSFGPIKTATALGGAVVRVRNGGLRARMTELQHDYPTQSRSSYARRLIKYAGLGVLGWPRVYGAAVELLKWRGADFDRLFANAARSFAGGDFFSRIRQQPSTPLVKMVARRVATFGEVGAARLQLRTRRGRELAAVLPASMVVGSWNATHTFWVTPVRVRNREALVAALRAGGFDATVRSSLVFLAKKTESCAGEFKLAPWLNEIVFLPNGDGMPDSEWQRMRSIVRQTAIAVAVNRSSEPAGLAGV